MAKFVVTLDKNKCIGAGECENTSSLWKVNNDGKSELGGSKLNPSTGLFELEVSEEEFEKQKMVQDRCPSQCIKAIKIG